MIFTETYLYPAQGIRAYYRQPDRTRLHTHSLLIGLYKFAVTLYDFPAQRMTTCDWPHPELTALARACDQAEPVVDWLLEHAETEPQRKLAAELEKLIGAARD